MVKRPFKILAFVYCAFAFPFMFSDLFFTAGERLLEIAGFGVLSKIGFPLCFLPVLLFLFFEWGNHAKEKSLQFRKFIGRMPAFLQFLVVLGATIGITAIPQLPFISHSLEVVEFDYTSDTETVDAARQIMRETGHRTSVSFSRSGGTVYLHKRDIPTKEAILKILQSRNISCNASE